MTSVLAALDSGACGRPVLDAAVALADLFGSKVSCLHVIEPELSIAPELARAAGLSLREVSGEPVEQIVAAGQDPEVIALVLGARALHGGAQPAGHTAREVITRVAKPVALVPPNARQSPRIARILVPLEGTGETSRALEGALDLAHRHGSEVLALHIHSPATVPAFADHDPHADLAWEREFLSRYVSTPRDRVSFLHRVGVPADDVVAVARETGSDLIFLAWKRDLTPGRALVVAQTLARSEVPILLLPVI